MEANEVRDTAQHPAPTEGRIAAFFDVDNTLVRGASLYAVARKMHQHKFFHFREVLFFALKQLSFLARGEHLGDITAIRDRALDMVRGVKVEQMRELGDEIYDEFIHPKLWGGTVAIARQHLNVGREVWLVTATPTEVAGVIARRLELTGALGTRVESENGEYTGRLTGPILHGADKAQAVRELAQQQNINLAGSWGYSDSYNDVPLLEVVGHPVAINPDARLRAYAKERGWQVYDFRTGQRAARVSLKLAGVIGALWAARRSLQRLRHGGGR
ncbi:HAD-IB family hydrolase [Glutamicibacter sp. V16R2B1]|uniref:HAD family hydrolase n=1 Tax=Glutamicibacter sp. V16R2B1 TaxID=2036207 RepID=UPI0010FD636D|nr:HAD-IB family hydrolase [Glutamicibacter sp. V16R2B1]TLK50931.1 HAD-IB family hydrolase [Glutamicibacter sp. V16R2B1]